MREPLPVFETGAKALPWLAALALILAPGSVHASDCVVHPTPLPGANEHAFTAEVLTVDDTSVVAAVLVTWSTGVPDTLRLAGTGFLSRGADVRPGSRWLVTTNSTLEVMECRPALPLEAARVWIEALGAPRTTTREHRPAPVSLDEWRRRLREGATLDRILALRALPYTQFARDLTDELLIDAESDLNTMELEALLTVSGDDPRLLDRLIADRARNGTWSPVLMRTLESVFDQPADPGRFGVAITEHTNSIARLAKTASTGDDPTDHRLGVLVDLLRAQDDATRRVIIESAIAKAPEHQRAWWIHRAIMRSDWWSRGQRAQLFTRGLIDAEIDPKGWAGLGLRLLAAGELDAATLRALARRYPDFGAELRSGGTWLDD